MQRRTKNKGAKNVNYKKEHGTIFSCKDMFEAGAYASALRDCRDKKNISVFNAQFFEKTFFTAAIPGRRVYVCADLVQAREAFSQLESLCANAVLLPPQDDVLTYKKLTSAAAEPERLHALFQIASGQADVVVTCAAALTQRYPQSERLLQNAFCLKKGKSYDLSDLKRRLADMGYKSGSFPTAAGQYSGRGDILDVWAVGADAPVRAEFFGDELESLRRVDAVTLLSGTDAGETQIVPATDVFYTSEEAARALRALKEQAQSERAKTIAADLSVKLETQSRELSLKYLTPFFTTLDFASFVRADAVVFEDAKQVYDTAETLYAEHAARFKTLRESGEVMDFSAHTLTPRGDVFSFPCQMTAFHRITSNNRIFAPQAVYTFDGMKLPDYSHDFMQLAADCKTWQGGYRVDILCGSENSVKTLGEFLTDNGVGYSLAAEGGGVHLYSGRVNRGGIFHALKRVVIGSYDISRKRAIVPAKRRKNEVFTVPEVGDFVVHAVHGIGLCKSVEKLNLTGSERDYLVIEYSGGDKLYVPVENMDSLSKYVATDAAPKLSKIGGADFDRVKKKVKESVRQLAFDLVQLYAERSKAAGHRYGGDDALLDEFVADFPYQETEDQLTAVREGLADLKSGKIMDRLLCGDVGYGKTEVALRLAFKVITEGKQAAFVSPTTILACQHYDTVVRRMEKYGVRVERLTRFDSKAKINETLARLQSGEADIVCGTHRVLSKDVRFKDLGLLILDEEQRFGVADKEKLKLLKPNVNVLSMSATPIPRTLYMTMVSVRDISVLDTPPSERIPVQTFVTEFSEGLVRDAVTREVSRGGQAFIVYNRVAGIDGFAAKLRESMPDVRFIVAHGQMAEGALEKAVGSFVSGGADVLVASTIIENGIDMPKANTLIVVDADRLGLSQLYQLRGRVGRSNRMAYAYFTYDNYKIMGEAAYKRLEAITEYTEFGSGFKIAMADLEIRGAGNILGREQHGHMEKVGYDMYCKLLAEAVGELEGKPAEVFREVKLTMDFPAFLPEGYVADDEKRMALYSRIAAVSTQEERQSFYNELDDVYGKPPAEAENLLDAALIKNLAAQVGAVAVKMIHRDCRVVFEKVRDIPEYVVNASMKYSGAILDTSAAPAIRLASRKDVLKFLLGCHKKGRLNN